MLYLSEAICMTSSQSFFNVPELGLHFSENFSNFELASLAVTARGNDIRDFVSF